jgi:CBS domain-containing protein
MGKNVRDVMTTRPRCVTPDTPIRDVAQIMVSEDVGAIPVLEEDRLTGVITDRDIVVRAVAEGKDPRGMAVGEIISTELVTVQADQGLSDALKLMATNQVRRLPVVDDWDRLVGVISQADIALEVREKAAGEMLEEISAPPEGPRV